MASSEDYNFKRGFDSRGKSKAQMSVTKILDTISAAAASSNSQGFEGEASVGRNVEKKGFLNIDLNVAPPDDCDFESPVAESGGPPPPPLTAEVGQKVGCIDESDVNFNEIEAHLSRRNINEFDLRENEATQMRTTKIFDEEKERENRGWNTLLDVAENALREHESNQRNKEEKIQDRKRKPSREPELGGELHKGSTRKKRRSLEWNDDSDVPEEAAVVVRSTRGRAVAMPNKYRDSVLDAVVEAEAEVPRHNKSGKSATVVSTKRKSR